MPQDTTMEDVQAQTVTSRTNSTDIHPLTNPISTNDNAPNNDGHVNSTLVGPTDQVDNSEPAISLIFHHHAYATSTTSTTGHHIPSPNTRVTIHSLPPEIIMLIFNLLAQSPARLPLPAWHFTHHLQPRDISSLPSTSIAPNGLTLPHIPNAPTPSYPATPIPTHVQLQCDCRYLFLAPFIYHRLFPYNVGAVCRRWLSILGYFPAFWGKIVVSRVAGTWTDPAHFEWCLQRSRGRVGIEVYIGSQLMRSSSAERDGNPGPGLTMTEEREMIARYTEVLKPHLWRCSVIDYYVAYSTSLPSIVDDLRGISSNLVSLRLGCFKECSPITATATSSVPTPSPDPRHGQDTVPPFPTSYPNLRDLSLNGSNFIQTTLHHPQLLRSVQSELTIHHYNHNLYPDDQPFSAHNVLEGIFPRTPSQAPAGLILNFDSTEFAPIPQKRYIIKSTPIRTPDSETESPVPFYHIHPPLAPMISTINGGPVDWSNIVFKCKNMSDQLLNDLIAIGIGSLIQCPQTVELDNCSISELDSIAALEIAKAKPQPLETTRSTSLVAGSWQICHIPEASFSKLPFPVAHMTIRNITDADSIINVIERLMGAHLAIHNCPAFTGTVLDKLCQRTDDTFEHYQALYADTHPEGRDHGGYHGMTLPVGIEDLTITDCANFTPRELWYFLEKRFWAVEDVFSNNQGAEHALVPCNFGDVWIEHPRCNLPDSVDWEVWNDRYHRVCRRFMWKYTPRVLTDFENEWEWDEEYALEALTDWGEDMDEVDSRSWDEESGNNDDRDKSESEDIQVAEDSDQPR
ncbi:hypothetical protein CVT24_006676 [Panaeolus cyanescens]|uniref:Uncharacterized protein n=1 Tax=Panaeolus cyanescens TaxID=181874 RepID=A0A409YRT8_9AGAR|nr:hypothetical protein CVT24_006676 [Panaeolus cyanescens]